MFSCPAFSASHCGLDSVHTYEQGGSIMPYSISLFTWPDRYIARQSASVIEFTLDAGLPT